MENQMCISRVGLALMLAMTLVVTQTACDGSPPAPAVKASRFDAVAPTAIKKDAIDGFCDTHEDGAAARAFRWPQIDGPAPISTGWTWVNVWATWCVPCVAEMPMLARWKEKLEKEGVKLNLAFLSVDSKSEDVTQWRTAHPEMQLGPRLTDFSLLGGWLDTVGLNANASIPIHFFVDGEQKIRCTRMGAISEPDYATVKQILQK